MSDALARLSAALADRYRVEREVGRGGMATVYLAEDLKHHRKVAIKVLREDLAASLGATRFLREIDIAAQLQHPNILPLLDSGEAGGLLFYVMPYVTGQSLRDRLDREGELPIQEAVRLVIDVVDALAYAHGQGVVHRDVKPDNVMLSGRHALITDFGVAKAVNDAAGPHSITTVGVSVGTPAYMSPEQAAADSHIDHRSDIYAVGVMAYELIAGHPPFTGATAQQVLAAQVTRDPEPLSRHRPGIPPTLEALIMRCLAKRPADRWQNAGELGSTLELFGTVPRDITPTAIGSVDARGGGDRARVIALVAFVVVLAVLGWWRLTSGGGQGDATRAIAVLPFENASRDTAFDYVADGVANDLRGGLTTLHGLSVRARTSSEAARGRTVREAGAMLNVSLVLQGIFHRVPDRVSLMVELVNVSDESALWTGTYDLPADGNFASAQDSITNAVARTLHLGATSIMPAAVTQRGTQSQDAYDHYLKGQYLFARRGRDKLYDAVDNFKVAISLDPRFARAQAGLAMVYSILPAYAVVGGDSLASEAERMARGALAIDSTLVDAHLALANAMSMQGRPGDAESEYMAALSLDSRSATAHQWHGANLAVLGRPAEAVHEARIAVELDPLSAVASNDLAYCLITAGQFEQAVLASRRGLELDASLLYGHQYLGIAYAFLGERDSAVQAFDRFFRADTLGPLARAFHVWSLALSGRRDEADRELATIEQTSTGNSHAFDKFLANLVVGNRSAALDALDHSVREHSFFVMSTSLGCDPMFGPLKSEPRFVAMLKQLGQSICPVTKEWPIPARAGASQP